MISDARGTWLDLERWDTDALREQWRNARPFPYVLLDDFLPPDVLTVVSLAIAYEPYTLAADEISEVLVSARTLLHPVLRSFVTMLGHEAWLRTVREITGKPVRSLQMRSHIYQPGHYLLPHIDDPHDEGRLVSLAFYTAPFGECAGGALELYDTRLEGRTIVEATLAQAIEPRPNRLVIFDVGDGTLHQVQEVTRGMRASISGWCHR